MNLCSRSQAHIIDVFVTAAEVSSLDDRDTSVDRDDPIIVGGKYPLRRLGKSICKPLIGCALFLNALGYFTHRDNADGKIDIIDL